MTVLYGIYIHNVPLNYQFNCVQERRRQREKVNKPFILFSVTCNMTWLFYGARSVCYYFELYSLEYVIAVYLWVLERDMISDGHVGSNVAHNASCCKQCGLLKLVMCR